VSFDPEDLRIEGNPLRINPAYVEVFVKSSVIVGQSGDSPTYLSGFDNYLDN